MAPVINLKQPPDPFTSPGSEELRVLFIVFFCTLTTVLALLFGFISFVCIPIPHYPPPPTNKTNVRQIYQMSQPDDDKGRYWEDTEANRDPIRMVRDRPRCSKGS